MKRTMSSDRARCHRSSGTPTDSRKFNYRVVGFASLKLLLISRLNHCQREPIKNCRHEKYDLGCVDAPSLGSKLLSKQLFQRSKSSPGLTCKLFAWCLLLQIVLQSPVAVVLGSPALQRVCDHLINAPVMTRSHSTFDPGNRRGWSADFC